MSQKRAEWLAQEFIGAFGQLNSRFATNTHDLPSEFPFAWTPATGHTFDCGVAVIGEAGSGVFWVADED